MRVPMKVDYGVRALVDLAVHQGDRPVPAPEIATRQSIPEAYLDQVLTALNRAGFVRSHRGPQGGHTLAKDPEEVTLGMIMMSLEGAAAPLECIDVPAECSLYDTCAQREVWQTVDQAMVQMLDSTSIADLAIHQQRLASAAGGSYQI